MKANVDPDKCIGCELCVNTCPEVFKMDGGVAVAIATPVPAEVEACCQEARDGCPVEAISLEE
jgi:ferredoxin